MNTSKEKHLESNRKTRAAIYQSIYIYIYRISYIYTAIYRELIRVWLEVITILFKIDSLVAVSEEYKETACKNYHGKLLTKSRVCMG